MKRFECEAAPMLGEHETGERKAVGVTLRIGNEAYFEFDRRVSWTDAAVAADRIGIFAGDEFLVSIAVDGYEPGDTITLEPTPLWLGTS